MKVHYSNPEILLINNPSHFGVRAVGLAYKRAFEFLGVKFSYYDFRNRPTVSTDEANGNIMSLLAENRSYKLIIMIQPSYMLANLYLYLKEYQGKGTHFIAICTEDPYSTYATIPIGDLFSVIYTNELEIEKLYNNVVKQIKYLPVAWDSLQPYKKIDGRIYDITFIMTMYESRLKYLAPCCNNHFNGDIFIAGAIGPLFNSENIIDFSSIGSKMPVVVPRHVEYHVYEQSKIVINPHREESNTGRSFFNLGEGVKCKQMIKRAYSPNPRFFDVCAMGAICMSDRLGCFDLLRESGISDVMAFDLNPYDDYLAKIKELLRMLNTGVELRLELGKMMRFFRENHSYVIRAKEILNHVGKNFVELDPYV